ncbi:proline-rich protein 4-like isoform X2 [Salvia hispanica]|uniref:proline-rich protein 4-like isoform X2 n=1 Tax=Salvia hispanica TaxID=49212 RepID=UPI0020090EAF|nr:proline-rich protein 4-like isoform X2 [Salvia hispanica]
MGLRLNPLVVGVFLLSLLCCIQAKTPVFEVVGAMHCSDCINNRNSSQGFEVVIKCNANEMRAQGNGGVDESGKFNVTLSAETAGDSDDTDGCYAKLQSRSGAPCHIQAAQTASLKMISNSTINITRPTAVVKFSPITCQSAFFWLFPNLTFFGPKPRPSPPEYTPPPAASPVQPPSPSPQPSYDTPAPSLPLDAPSPPPTSSPSPTLPPSSPVNLRRSPPPQNGPIQSPIAPIQSPVQTQPPAVIAPTPASSVRPVPAAGISAPPQRRRPHPIPKAPPIPELPVTPSVPRKYFNPPKSRSKPPRSL